MPSGSRIAIILGEKTADRDVRILMRVIRTRGHVPVMIPWEVLSVVLDVGGPHLCYRGRPVDVDGIVHCLSTGAMDGLAVLAAIEGGTPFLNPVESVLCAASRFATALRLVESGVPTPETALAPNDRELVLLARKYGYPVVLRHSDAACGPEAVVADTEDELLARAAVLWKSGAPLLVQRLVAEADTHVRRVVVVGGRFVTAARRGSPGAVRGAQEAVPLNDQEIAVAERTAKATGLDLAEVDVLPGPEGPTVVAVRAFPTLEGDPTGDWVDDRGDGRDEGREAEPADRDEVLVCERIVELIEQRILAGSAQRAMVSALAGGHPSALPAKLPSINAGAPTLAAEVAETTGVAEIAEVAKVVGVAETA